MSDAGRTETARDAGGPGRVQILLFGDGWSRIHEVEPGPSLTLTVGRDTSCGIVVDDKSVSRRHAEIVIEGGATSVRDLGSANGTRVDENLLEPQRVYAVLEGARVRVGGVTMLVYGAVPAPDAANPDEDALSADDPMREALELCDRVAASDLPVLLLGETGTGKEVLAERIHRRSARATGAFVRLNAAAVPEALAESQLFGHERGAFTGAVGPKDGVIVAANGGTLLLDEFGDLPPAVQTKLLRVVESGRMMRVGATTEIASDVRWIAATSRDVEALVDSGALRSDLVFRLAGITIRVPPLRDRPAAILPLARKLLGAASKGRARLAADAEQALLDHDWPGNVRELKATMQRAAVLSNYGEITAHHVFAGAFRFAPREREREPVPSSARPSSPPTERPAAALKDDLGAIERERILGALSVCGGNQTRAAEMLGISRRTLTSKLNRLDVARPRKRT